MNKKWLILALLIVVGVVFTLGAMFTYVIYTAPRMRVQPKLEDFSAVLPPLDPPAVDAQEAAWGGRPNLPIPATVAYTAENRHRGSVYYGYYCSFCHGVLGRGDGPVGQSYVPVPTDLGAPSVQRLSLEELAARMLKGTGHEPVLEYVVPPAHRPYLALYVKHLDESASQR